MRGFTKPGLWSFLQLSCRSFSVAVVEKADKAMLSKLRKQTGIPFINCRKALIKFDNDFNQAKKWLLEEAQKEGWAKATKLQTRPMSHGLVAVVGDGKKATMIEVNCETDFVARNEKFIALVSKLVQECSIHFEKSQEKLVSANKDVLSQVTSSDKSTFADIVALHIGSIGENMSLRRATYLRADSDSVLSTYVHPSSGPNRSAKSILLGKYGAIVELKQKHKVDKPIMALNELGSHICQHIVGMNPRAIGVYVPKETKVPDKEEEVTSAVPKDDAGYNSDDSSDVDKSPSPDIEEEKLLQQEYLLDTSMTVGEFLCINEVEVSHFVRYACGEELEGENEQ